MDATSLDGLDISVHAEPWAFTRPQRRLLRHNEDHQREIIRAVLGSDLEGAEKRATRINCCSQVVTVGVSTSGTPGVNFHRCRDRLCQICSRYRAIKAEERITGMLRSMLSPKLLTLTLAPSGAGLSHQLDRLTKCYRDLRRRKVWKRHVRGAAAVMEITRGANGEHWHCHLHCIIDAEYIPQATLSDEWLDCTGDSRIVDIRAIPSGAKAAKYLAKYAAKGCNTRLLDGVCLMEFVEALHRRRTLITSGSMHGLKIDQDDWEFRHQVVGESVSVARIRKAASSGCKSANRVLDLMVLAGGLSSLFAEDSGSAIMPLDEREWIRRYRSEFRNEFNRTRDWIENNGPAFLPSPPPFTGIQREFRDAKNE